jgi:cytochrome oxidase Cu insertion factor (SCO1/SenC/PrrC family)
MNLQNPKLVLLVIVLLFFGPLLLAIAMRSDWWDFKPSEFSNRGTLVQPPVEVDMELLEIQYPEPAVRNKSGGKWTVLYPLSGACDRACRIDVSSLRQVHTATGRNRDRVAVLLVAQQEVPAAALVDLVNIYPEFIIGADKTGMLAALLPALTSDPTVARFGDGRAFLLDPPGNIILGYATGFDPDHINKDLKRLLTWSIQDENNEPDL